MTTETRVSPGAQGALAAQPRRWLALAFLSVAQLILALDATIMNIALPSAQAQLNFSDSDRQWVITAYTLAFGGLLLLGGRIVDLVGRRRALLVGLLGFAAASAVGGTAQGLPLLILARTAQGACAALLAPAVLSALAVTFTEATERAKAFAMFGAIAGGGGAIGLVLGGILTESLGWRWCLYVNVPVAVVAAAGSWLLLSDPSGARGRRLDLPGALLVSAAMTAVVYGCARAATDGWGSFSTAAVLAAAAVLLAAFLLRESRVDSPLLPLRILRDRSRAGAYLSVASAVAGLLALFLSLTYYLQVVLNYSPTLAGVAFLPLSGAVLLSSQTIAARLLPRVQPRLLIVPGLLLGAAAMALLARLPIEGGYATRVLPAEILMGLGMGCVFVPAINTATQRVDRAEAGVAAAVVNTSQQIGGSIGVAVLNTVATSATVAFLAAHAGMANAHATALVHGYRVAAAGGAGLLVVAAIVVGLLVNESPASRATSPDAGHSKRVTSSPRPRQEPSQGREVMSHTRYLRPPWGARVIGNRLARIFARGVLSTLTVRGRRTGRSRTVPVAVLEYGGNSYLIAPRGETDWVRNLRAAGSGLLTRRGRSEQFDAVEVAVAERPPLIGAYVDRFGKFPTVLRSLRELPDPADHPTFRLVSPRPPG